MPVSWNPAVPKRNLPRTLPLFLANKEDVMAQGSKEKYTKKQKRKAEHIEEGYEDRGTSKGEAERRAWATVNSEDHGGKKSGSGRGKKSNTAASRRGGRKATKALAGRKGGQATAAKRKKKAKKK
jgi:plasmid stabilization system protein ParE